MKASLKILLIMLTGLILSSCTAPTYISSWRDPGYKGNPKKILVVALIKDFEYRLAYETSITDMINKNGIKAETSMNMIGVEKKLTKEEIINILENGKFDALLAVKYTGSKTTERKVPPSSFVDWYWGGYDVMYTPGYTEKHSSVNTEAVLYTEYSEGAVWYATLKTIDAYNRNDLTSSLAKKIVEDLIINEIL